MAQDYWNEVYSEFKPYELDPAVFRATTDLPAQRLIEAIGEVAGKEVLEIGCGDGRLSVYFAKLGGRVTAIDNSLAAVESARALAAVNGVSSSVQVYHLDAMELNQLGRSFDLVFGKFILHHLEPFEQFCEALSGVIKPGGQGTFYENNAGNPILIFSRAFLAGRFGIPKYGDQEEYPFEPKEVAMLQRRFDRVCQLFPEFVFFRLLGSYLFRKSQRWYRLFEWLDGWVLHYWSGIHKYSYHQIVGIQKY